MVINVGHQLHQTNTAVPIYIQVHTIHSSFTARRRQCITHIRHTSSCSAIHVSAGTIADVSMVWWWLTGARTQQTSGALQEARNLCLPVDASQHSTRAVAWALEHVVRPSDKLHIVAVESQLAGPYPAEVVDADVPGPFSADVLKFRSEKDRAASETQNVLQSMSMLAANQGVPSNNIKTVQLKPSGGASGVGASIVGYARDMDADLVVLGSRNLTGWKSAMMNLLGLASVSTYAVKHAPCPVLVVKDGQEHDD